VSSERDAAAYSERALEIHEATSMPLEPCVAAVRYLGGTAGEYEISDAVLAILIAVANGLADPSALPRGLRL
jgi:hypothetical protein